MDSFYDFELEVQLLSSQHGVQVLLPELAYESEPGKATIEIYQELQTGGLPQLQQRHSSSSLAESHVGVKRKDHAFIGEIAKRVAVQMIAVSQISREVRICPVRCDELYNAAVAGDAMQLGHNCHRVTNVFDYVPADHLIELVIRKRIGQIIEIMDHVGGGPGIYVHANSAGDFVGPTANVEHSRFAVNLDMILELGVCDLHSLCGVS